MLRANHLAKSYKQRQVVKDVSLEIQKGEIVGLLGPNGAGKSTFINILAGLVVKSSGTASIWGLDIDREPRHARAAIGAVDLAVAGFRGPHDILTGPYGYLTLFEQNDHDIWSFLENLGKDWQVLNLAHKPYPSGRLTHGVVDGLGQLMDTYGFQSDDIEKIECRVPPLVHRLVGREDVPSPESNYAKLCLRFVAGVFLKKGTVGVPDFRGMSALEDEDIHLYASLVDVVLDDNPDQNALNPQTVSVHLKSGANHNVTLPCVYGHPDNPLSPDENEEKFRCCMDQGREASSRDQVDALIAAVADLDSLPDVSNLISLTMGQSG